MAHYVVIEYNNEETARLECESLEEAQMVRRSFVNYGKDIVGVSIETEE